MKAGTSVAIVYETLRDFPIPEVHERRSKRDTAFYALSIGFGQDPMDERELDFVDALRPLKAVPSMAAVLGHPGFWIRDPRTGADPVQLVHAEQGFVIHETLPIEGEVVGRTHVSGLIDKGPGRPALVYTVREVRDRVSGRLLATATSTTFLKGQGGFGGPAGPVQPVHAVPSEPADLAIDLETRPEQALYYRLNGDDNPLHSDPRVAAKAGFPRPILHGLATLGVIVRALLRGLCDYEPTRLKALDLRFSAPVFPGETIRTEIWRSGAFRAWVPARAALVVSKGHVEIATQ